ncbi:hypothetical protein NIES4075_44330 [Tolypothrix sp. NIES-4075]|uniref:hypothetical protein n=1 Tax=Tolypothrix sp. NIES-4075 TaxID=2005459 RepID=UPI000B5C4E61|nr:hypothetical protein [Tolypothrix sp. NIES-4075]GAX43420.1 hypothetical protein NIES4075_44330 [Tolypothrix sp. NIES-4075]
MLSPYQLEEVTAIAHFASNCLESWGYKEFAFSSLRWDENRAYWIVGFVITGNQEIFIGIQRSLKNSYRYGGIVGQ